MTLNSIKTLIRRLRRGHSVRQKFVESQVSKGLAFQIRAMRDRLGLSQEELAQKTGMNQNAISRLESYSYGKPTLTTLKRLAAAFDVGLIVRFAPFSEMIYWASGTPYQNKGLSTESLFVPTFGIEEEGHVFDSMQEEKTKTGLAAVDLNLVDRIYQSTSIQGLLMAGGQKFFGGTEAGSTLKGITASTPSDSFLGRSPLIDYSKPRPSEENVTKSNWLNSGATEAARAVNP
jgi:transcriptional regulator with XRE-family HTH domain